MSIDNPRKYLLTTPENMAQRCRRRVGVGNITEKGLKKYKLSVDLYFESPRRGRGISINNPRKYLLITPDQSPCFRGLELDIGGVNF